MTGSIVFEDVWKVYRQGRVEYPALRGVSVEVRPGELIALLGPSGSGKTTFIYLAGGIETPTRGRVVVNGHDITRMGEGERARWRRRNVGIVFQFFHLIPSLTALENVMLPMILAGHPPKPERRRRALELLDLVGMRDKADKFPSQLSGGEQQRVAIARALAADPPLILADEPTANLDTENKRRVIDLLVEANRMGKTVLYTTHDPELASKAQRVIKIVDGRIVD
ncbi:MAG: ABC transporter ATP-binding protein [Desulfurococcales archaeon]|nr:ABC transporter ATP-binding protein [Desulfurococcales archaeon]